MGIRVFIFLLQLIFVYCQSGEDGEFEPRFDNDLDMTVALRSRIIEGLELSNSLHRMFKRQGRGYTDFSDEEAVAIVERHNFHRSNTDPPASDMKHMTWDNDLATMSQKWADTCIYEHGGYEGSQNTSPWKSVGQNLAVGTSTLSSSGVYATNAWHSEDEFFTYETNSCRPGEMCGHYTQVVWAGSETVGCGRKLCPTILVNGRPWRNAYYVVCDYGPAGNFRGQKPFKRGDRCSECPSDAGFCSDNSLCRDCSKVSNIASCGECSRTCENCGTLDSASCTCQCAPGWEGPSCSDPCADHHEWCGANPGWYGPELCNGWDYSESVRKYCLKMCGICQPKDPTFVCGGGGGGGGGGDGGGGGGDGCSDDHSNCPSWAESGECEANPAWMLANCKRSCQVCEPTLKNTKYCKTSFTAASVIDGNLFVFKKDKFWRFDDVRNGKIETGASGDLVRNIFPKVNPDVRAIYQRPDNKVAIFRGAKYWLYTYRGNGWSRDAGFPRDISNAFPGLPSPTAAVYDAKEGKTYFFSGANYWRFDERQQRFDIEKKPVSTKFDGIPNKISGAFIDENSDFILVKGKDYWRVPRGHGQVTSTVPKNLALHFMDCYE